MDLKTVLNAGFKDFWYPNTKRTQVYYGVFNQYIFKGYFSHAHTTRIFNQNMYQSISLTKSESILTHLIILPIVQLRLWLGDFLGCLTSGDVRRFSLGVFNLNGLGRPDRVLSILPFTARIRCVGWNMEPRLMENRYTGSI